MPRLGGTNQHICDFLFFFFSGQRAYHSSQLLVKGSLAINLIPHGASLFSFPVSSTISFPPWLETMIPTFYSPAGKQNAVWNLESPIASNQRCITELADNIQGGHFFMVE